MNKQKYQSPSLEFHAPDTVDIIMGSAEDEVVVSVIDPLYRDIAMTYLEENDMEHFSAYYR